MKGAIQVYTGSGKGKTSAGVGLAARAISHNFKTGYVHFHKERNGEDEILSKLGCDIFFFAKKHPHFNKDVQYEEIRKECLKGLEFIKEIYKENKYDLLILDEINISLDNGFIKEEEMTEILELKPKNLELVLTGRGFPESLIEKVDYVSKIENIKHPYDKGIRARKGIEY